MLLFITIIFGVLLVLGLPIAFVMGLTTLFSFFSLGNPNLYNLIPQRMYSGIANFVLIAIPFFIMTGEVMTKAGITAELVRFSNLFVGRLRGGLAHINIVSSVLFAGISGSAASDAASIGSILIPAMNEEGYDLDFSAAVTASSAAIGPVIPPSIIMIIYASLMDVSVAGLFLAGYAPGILIAIGLMILAYILSKKRGYPIHTSKITLREIYRAFKGAILPLLLPVIIIAGILFGAFTPTEASVVAAAYALFLGLFIKKTIKIKDIPEILTRTVKTSSLVLFVIGTGIAFGWILSYEQIPQKLASILIMFGGHKAAITIFLILVILFLAGMFMDTAVSIVVLGPLLLTTAIQLGVHPLHFAMIMCLSLTVGLITPPLGLVLFVVCSVTKLKFERLCKAMVPFIIIEFIVILIITYIPYVAMTIPRLFGFYP
jgi:tripartite ATP-independent transporter DctM subunit